jgi:choline dehydrogenase-like flavoprotein
MGDVNKDPLAVVDPQLKVRGLKGLRIADAGVFPEMTTINPMLTVLGVGERAAELVAEAWGWKGPYLNQQPVSHGQPPAHAEKLEQQLHLKAKL